MRIKAVITPIIIGLALTSCSTFHTPRDKAMYYYKNGYYKQAYPTLFELARRQDPEAMYAVGYMRYYGMGVSKDTDIARDYIGRAAKMGYAPATDAVKMIYEDHPNMRVEEGGRQRPIVYKPQIHGVPAVQKVQWIRDRYPYHFTLIVDANKKPDPLAKEIQKAYKIDVAKYSQSKAKHVVSKLVIGDFKDEAAAVALQKKFSPKLKKHTHIARFAQVQSVMLPDDQ